jgi:hypothetical protein
MKTLLLAAALAFTATAASAGTDQLPEAYLGQWCPHAYDTTVYYSADDLSECGDSGVTIKRDQFLELDSACRFRSIKRTNDLRPNHTQPTKADWTPVVEVIAQCKGEGETWISKIRLIYQKGSLTIKGKVIR